MATSRSARLNRRAAIQTTLHLALALGICCLILAMTDWNQKPEESEPFYTELPGVDLGGLTQAQKDTLLKKLNIERCPCDCDRTIASCRNHHDSCSFSLARARAAVEAARKK